MMVLRSQIDCLEKAADSPEIASLRATNAIALDSVAAMTEMAANLAVVVRSAEVAVSLSRVDLAEVLEELRTSRCRSAALRQISLKVKASGLSIVTDRRLLQRILYNLTDSVIEHSGATKVVVGVRMHGEDCMMQVVHNGPGASVEEGRLQHSIYGLGRFVVRSLVKKLGGSIRFDARAGRGACIQVVLPGPTTYHAAASWGSAPVGSKSN
jgi:signal transduction histidine kinase